MTDDNHGSYDPIEALRIGVQRTRDDAADALARRGFRRLEQPGQRWRGTLTVRTRHDEGSTKMTMVEIEMGEDYPLVCPKVLPLTQGQAEAASGKSFADNYHEAGWGWHRDRDQSMCLFIEADHTKLPWSDGQTLVDQAQAWLEQDAAGWPGPEPALDLERYLEISPDDKLVLYGALDGCDGKILRLRPERNGVLRVGRTMAALRRTGSKGGRHRWDRNAILVVNAGEVSAPLRTWDDLLGAIGAPSADALRRAHDRGLRRVLTMYARHGVRAVLAIDLHTDNIGTITPKSLRAAPDNLATRSVRAHPEVARLACARVAIVGMGAIGSVVADLLHRSGVGHLDLIDSDTMLPGNTTRHLLDNTAIGVPKARAVAEALDAVRPDFGTIAPHESHLCTLRQATDLLSTFDLVVDATADSSASAVLGVAARAGVGLLLSVCVLADGYAVRVDRTPLRPGEVALPDPVLPPVADTVYESGCGSPVSTTPPAGVWEAAAIAARHAIQLLLDPKSGPPGEERILDPTREPA